MGIYFDNKPISCLFCNYGPIQGRESSYTDRHRGIVTECRWSCPRCGRLVRCDEKVQPRVARKEEIKKEETKKTNETKK